MTEVAAGHVRECIARYRVPAALALLAIILVGPIVAPDSAQPASRITLSAALVEHHTVDLGRYRAALGIDYSTYRGRLRSDKGPGQPLFAAPAYALARLAGAPSASHLHVNSNLELWWVTFWSATIPFAVLLGLLYLACKRFATVSVALGITLATGLGTMLLPYAANLFGHELAAVLAFAAWLALERASVEPRRAALAGFLAGAAITVEYETAIVAAVLVGYLLVRHRRRIAAFAAGAVLPMLVLAGYQWRAFGAPWRTPAAFYHQRSGYFLPSPSDLGWMFVGDRGLWLGAPVAIVALGSAIGLACTRRGRVRDHAIVGLAVVVPYIVLSAGWSGTRGLEFAGPRYLVPALPFLAVPLAATWDRVRLLAVPAAVFGVFVNATATWGQLLVARGTSVLTLYRYRVRHHQFVPTLWSIGLGRVGVVVYAASVAGAVAIVVRGARRAPGTALLGHR